MNRLEFMHFRYPESTCWIANRCFIFVSIQTPQQSCCLTISSLKNTCFLKNLCAVGEFAIGLVLVISWKPVFKSLVNPTHRKVSHRADCLQDFSPHFGNMNDPQNWEFFASFYTKLGKKSHHIHYTKRVITNPHLSR